MIYYMCIFLLDFGIPNREILNFFTKQINRNLPITGHKFKQIYSICFFYAFLFLERKVEKILINSRNFVNNIEFKKRRKLCIM